MKARKLRKWKMYAAVSASNRIDVDYRGWCETVVREFGGELIRVEVRELPRKRRGK